MIKETLQHNSEKIVYFVRHGESVGNAAGVFQSHTGGLSPEGMEQARALAERFKNIPVDVILASTTPRARETADAIHDAIQKPIEFSNLLVEIRNPSEIRDKLRTDKEARGIKKSIRIEDHEPAWRYSDEENFSDRMERAGCVVEMLLGNFWGSEGFTPSSETAADRRRKASATRRRN